MKRHEIWRLGYRKRRYMQHLTDGELRQRFPDIFINMLTITNAAKIGPPPINEEGKLWFILYTHVLEEFAIRFGPLPSGFGDGVVQVPFSDFSLLDKAAELIKKAKIPEKYLVKYGKLKYLKSTFELGQVRVSPATYYSDPSLNPAIHDNELELFIQPPPSELRMEVFDQKTKKSKGTIKPKWGKISKVSQTNYYVYCLSSLFVPRLFHDFDADSCLVIYNPRHFIDRLIEEFMQNNPGFITIAEFAISIL